MSLAPYRQVLAVPGVRTLLLVGIIARVPATAVGMTLTLYVANAMGRPWAQAGLVTAAFTVGAAVGQPLMGRLIDRRGLRPVVVLTGCMSAAIWLSAPHLSYGVLIAAAVVGGLFGLPIYSAIRLGLAALTVPEQRRSVFALDSMIVELSFMAGPAIAVVLATSLPGGYGVSILGFGLAGSAGLMYAFNPRTRPEGHEIPDVAPSRRSWLGPGLISLLAAGVAVTFILSATDLTIVATLRDSGAVRFTGLAIALWCAYSLVGGLVFGAMHRRVSVFALIAAMGVLTIPVGLAPTWQWLLVALIPCGALCAPTMVSANDTLTRIVPAESRGEATGLLGSALTAGTAIGAPIAGAVIDNFGTAWAFAIAGAVGAVCAFAGLPAARRHVGSGPSVPASTVAVPGSLNV